MNATTATGLRSEAEIHRMFDSAVDQMERTGGGTESRVRSALLVRCLGWVLGMSDGSPLLTDLDA